MILLQIELQTVLSQLKLINPTAGLVLTCSDERKCAVMKAVFALMKHEKRHRLLNDILKKSS